MSGERKAHATLLQSLCKVDRPKEDLARQPQRTRFCLPPKCGFSSARRTGAMCAVRAFGLLEYMSTCGTQRTRFRPLKRGFSRARRTEPMCTGVHEAPWNAAVRFCLPLKAGSDAQGARSRCVLDVREVSRNAAHQVLPRPISRSDRRRSRPCAYPSASRRCPSWGRTRPSRRAGRTPCGRRCAGPVACCGSP